MQPVSVHTICTFSCTLASLIFDILLFACHYLLFACQMRVNYVVCMLSHAVLLCNINLQLFLFSHFCPKFPVISLYIITVFLYYKYSCLTISYSQFLLWTEFRYTMLTLNKPRCLYWDSVETLWVTL